MPAILRGERDLLRASPKRLGSLIQDRLTTDGLSNEAKGLRAAIKTRKRLEYKRLRLLCSPARYGMQKVAGSTYGTRQLTRACWFFDIPCKFQTKTTKCVPYTEPPLCGQSVSFGTPVAASAGGAAAMLHAGRREHSMDWRR